jgi:RNA polymerase sigma-70 factor (ECF subfamily)
VAAARSGDRAALDALLRRHHDRLYAVCRRLTGNDADAYDALQDALIAIVRGLDRFDGRSRFTTWSYRVATNATLDELRRRRRRPLPGLPEDDAFGATGGGAGPGRAGGGPTGRAGAWGPDPGAPVAGRLDDAVADRVDVDAALALVPEDFRVAVVLRDLCGLDYAEIAEVLEIPPGTVRSRIARGRGLLAAHLGNRGATPERPSAGP